METSLYVVTGVRLSTDDRFYVVWSDDGSTWETANRYPDDPYGYDGEITVSGMYDVYFRPDGQGDSNEGWVEGCLLVTLKTTLSDYYVYGALTDWQLQSDYRLADPGDGAYTYSGLALTPNDRFFIVYSEDGNYYYGETVQYPKWNPYGDNGEIAEAGTYDVFFRPDGQGDPDEGWVDGLIRTARRYTVTVLGDENGTAEASVASGLTGTQVTLTATLDEGYCLKEWRVESGGVTVTDNTFTIGEADVQITAVFALLPRVLFDFEDEADDHQTARWSGYDGYNAGVVTTCTPVTAETGKVHSGAYAMAYDMDFSQLTYYEDRIYSLMCYNWDDIATHGFTYDEDGIRQRGAEEDFVDITGAAGIGMWIYIPDEVDVRGLDVRYTIGGKKNPTSAYTRIDSAMGTLLPYRDGLGTDGWYYYYFDLSNYSDWVCLRLQNTRINNSISKNGKYPGAYTVTVKGKGNFTGVVKKSYTITEQPLDASRVTLEWTEAHCNGTVQQPGVTVKNAGGYTMTLNKSYTVSYSADGTTPGSYTVTVRGKGYYTGTVTKTFTID